MLFHLKSQDRQRLVAKSLKAALARHGRPAKLSACQAAVARMFGYRDWHHMEKSTGTNEPSLDDAWCPEEVVSARRALQASIVAELAGDVATALRIVEEIHPTNFVRQGAAVGSILPLIAPSWDPTRLSFRTRGGPEWQHVPSADPDDRRAEIVYGLRESGKSTLVSRLSYAFGRGWTWDRATRVATIGYGTGVRTVPNLLRESCEAPIQVENLYLDLSGTHAINVMDTPPGCRFPSAEGYAFLVEFVLLITGLDHEPSALLREAVLACLKGAYRAKYHHMEGLARPYEAGVVAEVDIAVGRGLVSVDEDTSWWDVVDALHSKKEFEVARLAQRQAVPTLQDLARIDYQYMVDLLPETMQGREAENLVDGDAYYDDAEHDGISLRVESALHSNPALGLRSAMDLSEADFVSIELHDFGTLSPHEATRGRSLAFMLARFLVMRDFDLVTIDQTALSVACRRSQPPASDATCRVVVDDFSSISVRPAVERLAAHDMRLARTLGFGLTLVVDDVRDLNWPMTEHASAIWVVALPNEDVELVTASTGLGRKGLLAAFGNGPSGERGNVYLFRKEKSGVVELALCDEPAPDILWAFATDTDDASLRDGFLRRMDRRSALDHLARLHPEGNAREGVRRLVKGSSIKGRAWDTGARTVAVDMLKRRYEGLKGSVDASGPNIVRWRGLHSGRKAKLDDVVAGRFWWCPVDYELCDEAHGAVTPTRGWKLFEALLGGALRVGSIDLVVEAVPASVKITVRRQGHGSRLNGIILGFDAALEMMEDVFAAADVSPAVYDPFRHQSAKVTADASSFLLPFGVDGLRMEFSPMPSDGRRLTVRILRTGTLTDSKSLPFGLDEVTMGASAEAKA